MSSFVYKVIQTFYENFHIKKYDEVEGIFSGILVKYGNRDKQGDIILPASCNQSIVEWGSQARLIPALYEHDLEKVISKNMFRMVDSNNEVYIEFQVSDDFKANYPEEFKSMVASYREGGAFLSVGINGAKSSFHRVDKIDNSIYVRYIFDKVYIVEGSFTRNPANPSAKVEYMKSMENIDTLIKGINSFSKAEEFLRKNTDFTQGQCNTIIKNILAMGKNSSSAQNCQPNKPEQVEKTAVEEILGL